MMPHIHISRKSAAPCIGSTSSINTYHSECVSRMSQYHSECVSHMHNGLTSLGSCHFTKSVYLDQSVYIKLKKLSYSVQQEFGNELDQQLNNIESFQWEDLPDHE